MFEHVDKLLAAADAPVSALRHHRVELLEIRRRRAAGLELEPELAAHRTRAVTNDLAVQPMLARARAAWDGPLLLMKGPELALDYGAPGLRTFGDLDLLTDDAEAAQAALIAAGFQEVFDPEVYQDIHHLRPLWWPGMPLVIELHMRANWPRGIDGPTTEELLAAAVPGRLGVAGVNTLPPAHHTLLLAAHAWEHQPLGRLGNLVDVAVMLRRSDPAEVAALARRWGCSRLWRTTHAAVRAVVEGEGRSVAVSLWARHVSQVRERTVLEWHLKNLLSPAWGLSWRRAPARVGHQLAHSLTREGREPWRAKAGRARLAMQNAGIARSEHDLALRSRGLAAKGRFDAE
jgi:hypothetical protein